MKDNDDYDDDDGERSGVTRGTGGGPPRMTLSRGVTPEQKILWLNLQRTMDRRGRMGKKVRLTDTLLGVTPE